MFSQETGSLNPMMEDLEGRVQVMKNSSSLYISNLTSRDFMTDYSCVVLDERDALELS